MATASSLAQRYKKCRVKDLLVTDTDSLVKKIKSSFEPSEVPVVRGNTYQSVCSLGFFAFSISFHRVPSCSTVTWGKQLPVADTLPLCCSLFVGGKIDGSVRLNGIVKVRMV